MPYSRLYYHFVWAIKNRAEIIRESNREPLYAAIRAKVRDLGGMTHALNGLTEHVHLVARLDARRIIHARNRQHTALAMC